jgi:hypothetical protein
LLFPAAVLDVGTRAAADLLESIGQRLSASIGDGQHGRQVLINILARVLDLVVGTIVVAVGVGIFDRRDGHIFGGVSRRPSRVVRVVARCRVRS